VLLLPAQKEVFAAEITAGSAAVHFIRAEQKHFTCWHTTAPASLPQQISYILRCFPYLFIPLLPDPVL
jgi:hypothetical protein